MVDHVKNLVVGQDPWDRRRLWDKMYRAVYSWGRRGLPIGVIGAIEIALWDICGKEAGVPVYDLLGGAAREAVPVYASGGLEQCARTIAEEAAAYVEEGYRAVKIRLFQREWYENFELAQAAREAVGPKVRLLLDPCQQWQAEQWTVGDAVEVARSLESLNPFWIEDPYNVNDLAGLLALKKATRIPVAVGETLLTHVDYMSYLQLGAADFIQTDVCIVGGLEEARKVASLAEAYGATVATHVWGTAVSLAVSLHFGISVKNLAYVESPKVENPLRERLFVDPPRLVEGKFRLARAPGLGVELDEAVVSEYLYEA